MNPLQFFVSLDQKAVSVLESLCHRQQRLLGTSHYFWLKLFAIAHAAFAFVFMLPVGPPAEDYKAWLLIVALLCSVPGFTWWERRSLNRMLKGLANPLLKDQHGILIRCLVGYLYTPLIIAIVILGVVISISKDNEVIWLYLGILFWWLTFASLFVLPACDPLPPVTGKWREWLSKMFLKPTTS